MKKVQLSALLISLARSPAYLSLWLRSGFCWRAVQEAGFIVEPRRVVRLEQVERLAPGSIVLVLTGCFNPLHKGHLEALSLARDAVQAEVGLGGRVVRGYLAATHLSYAGSKTASTKSLHQLQRARYRELRSHGHDWIRPFWFEERCDGPLNFTTVLHEVRRVHPGSMIVMVYGSDNAYFQHALTGLAVEVPRDCKAPTSRVDWPASRCRVLYIPANKHASQSSTKHRGAVTL